MSNSKNPKNKEAKDTEEKQKKTVTKYDRKVQRRKEQKAKEERDKKIGKVAGIVLAAALVCFVASFPIRTFLTVKGTYITVGGESISRVEFDYHYNVAMSNYLNGNGMWLQYMGVDLSGDLSKQMYSEDMSWKDRFDELAVEGIAQNEALIREGKAAGFVHDTAEDYKEYMDALRESASEQGITVKEYIQSLFGPYATESRVKPFVEKMMYANAYYQSVVDTMSFSQDEIEQYYDEDKNNYDRVDFRLSVVNAQLPKEPTELADPVETPAPAEGDSSGTTGTGTDGAQNAYTPSEAEIAKAMEIAKTEADELEKTIRTKGELTVGASYSDVTYMLRDWVFSEERKAGDTTVIEHSSAHSYYVLAFEKRYRNERLSADARVIVTDDGRGQEILDEWKSGTADEAGFAALCDKYGSSAGGPEGGLYEGIIVSNLSDELRDWLSDSSRASGDTVVISPEDGAYSYVIYYVAANRPEWILSIENTLRSNRASEYLEELVDSVSVEDKKGNLNYLKVYAQREAENKNSSEDATPTEAPGEQ